MNKPKIGKITRLQTRFSGSGWNPKSFNRSGNVSDILLLTYTPHQQVGQRSSPTYPTNDLYPDDLFFAVNLLIAHGEHYNAASHKSSKSATSQLPNQ